MTKERLGRVPEQEGINTDNENKGSRRISILFIMAAVKTIPVTANCITAPVTVSVCVYRCAERVIVRIAGFDVSYTVEAIIQACFSVTLRITLAVVEDIPAVYAILFSVAKLPGFRSCRAFIIVVIAYGNVAFRLKKNSSLIISTNITV